MRTLTLLTAVALASCATAPKPPTVDGRSRVPVNGPAAVQLLDVMAEPVPAPVAAAEPGPRTFTRAPDPDSLVELGRDGTVSRVIFVPFKYAGNAFRPTPEQRYRMRRLSTIASHVEVRGRTDSRGNLDSNRMLAMQRAMAAKRYLIELGMPAELIAINYVASGDPVGDEGTTEGRAKNRRAEIEFHISPETRS